jgi:hypothetical protein
VRQREPTLEHVDRRLDVTGAEHLQVEPAAEHPLVAGDHHRAGVLTLGAVQRVVDRLQHGGAEDVDLAVVHRDHRDGLVACDN